MRQHLSELTIDKFIVHDVPSKYSAKYLKQNPNDQNLEPVLSDIETPFSEALRRFFKDKLSSSIGSSNSFSIKYKNIDGVVPSSLESYFTDNNNDIISSQEIAKHLHQSQNARNSGSLLLFVFCHVRKTKAVAILKVEREEGVQINKLLTDDGHTRFSMEHIENLMLTQKTKLFKIALFYKESGETKGLLSDQQMGFNIGKEVAMYFLSNFLDCQLVDDPSVTTKKFFESAQKFVNDSDMSAEKKAKTFTHILSALTNNTGAVNIQAFAENNLDIEYADNFINFMQDQDIPTTSFVKDVALIHNKLSKRQFVFDSGIYVIVPENITESQLSYEGADGRKIKMQIIDSLKKVGAK